ncbi:hypothetical protein [Streptomyces sp. ECR3.8]|uniref:hypothetical protein n=1 Tax=Streptomyces sp. ECR3.8 TaxID=3461009 RepID=UPI0040421270
MVRDDSTLYELLMDWVYEKVGDHRYKGASLKSFAEEHCLTSDDATELLKYGIMEGGVAQRWGTPGKPAVSLTPKGLDLLVERRRCLAPPIERNKAARRLVLRRVWLVGEARMNVSVSTKALVGTPEATVAGYALSAREIARAAGYLKGKGLITGYTGSSEGPDYASITAEGQDCMENYNGDPDLYDKRGHTGATYNTYLPNAHGVIVGEQQNFTQNNTTGIDPSAFIQLAGYVSQVSNTLGLSGGDHEELRRAAHELHDEATSSTPQPSRIRLITSQIRDRLLEAGTTMAATVGVQMAEQALASLTP